MFLRWFKKRKENNLVGLDIGSDALKLLKINSSQPTIKVGNFAIIPMPAGAIVKEEIKEVNVVGEALKDLVRASGVTVSDVALSIPKSATIIKTISIDKRLTDDEVESRAWIEANRHFPDLVGDIHLDFSILGPSAQDTSQLELVLVACRKDQLKPYLEVLKLAGLTVKVVDVSSYALERALAIITKRTPDLKTTASLNLDFNLSTLIVVHENNLIYAHDQSFDGQRLMAQISKLMNEEKSVENEGTSDEAKYMATLKEIMGAHLRHTMHFFYSSRPNIAISRLILNGDCATIPHLAYFIQQELGVETVIANPFADMEVAATIEKTVLMQNAPRLMLCCGVALSALK